MQPQCIELFVFFTTRFIYQKSQHNKAVASLKYMALWEKPSVSMQGEMGEHFPQTYIYGWADCTKNRFASTKYMKIERSGKTRKAENIKSTSTQKTKIQADKLKLSAACANNRPILPQIFLPPPFSGQHSTQWRPLDHLLHLAEYTLEKKGKTHRTKLRA